MNDWLKNYFTKLPDEVLWNDLANERAHNSIFVSSWEQINLGMDFGSSEPVTVDMVYSHERGIWIAPHDSSNNDNVYKKFNKMDKGT